MKGGGSQESGRRKPYFPCHGFKIFLSLWRQGGINSAALLMPSNLQYSFPDFKEPGSIQYIYLFVIVTGNEMHYG